jgi:hypothetical protein
MLTAQQIKDFRNLASSDKYFHVFCENHLKQYPNERINGFAGTENVDPLTGMRLFSISENLKNIEDSKLPERIIHDLLQTATEVI